MTKASNKLELLILDACVLIDFIKADTTVLALIHKYVGTIHVIEPVLKEVLDIEDVNELTESGIIIIEPEIEDAFTATKGSGSASFQDQLCLLTAKRNGFTCVTNDVCLRKLCESHGVPILWGLELLKELHKLKGISTQDVLNIANLIHENNPKHITPQIVQQFTAFIRAD